MESTRLLDHSSDKILEALDQSLGQSVFHQTADPLAMMSEASCKPLKSCESVGITVLRSTLERLSKSRLDLRTDFLESAYSDDMPLEGSQSLDIFGIYIRLRPSREGDFNSILSKNRHALTAKG